MICCVCHGVDDVGSNDVVADSDDGRTLNKSKSFWKSESLFINKLFELSFYF